jgi:hypothetical protein
MEISGSRMMELRGNSAEPSQLVFRKTQESEQIQEEAFRKVFVKKI